MGTEALDQRLTRMAEHCGAKGFRFDDLVRAAVQVGVVSLTAVTDWLAHARSSGFVEDVGFDPLPDGSGPGPRRYRRAQPVAGESAREQRVPTPARAARDG